MSDVDLIHLLVEIDEFHEFRIIEFVEYDERIYEWCLAGGAGRTTHDAKGNMVAETGREPAQAGDWYRHAEANGLM